MALFEAFKGLLALAALLGLLSLLHHDVHALALALIGHVGWAVGASGVGPGHDPALALHELDRIVAELSGAGRRPLVLAVCGYALLRFTEAWGLWRARAWGEWLGVASVGLYVPFEVRHLAQQPTALAAAVLAVNLGLVGFLAWRLWRRRRGPPAGLAT